MLPSRTKSKTMAKQEIEQYRYSTTDVVFDDACDADVPDEYQALFKEYCVEVDILPVKSPMWRSPGRPKFKNCMLEKARHKAYTKSLLCSGDEEKIQAAEEAMLSQLGRYYESFQLEKYHKEMRANLELMRKREKRHV